MFTKNHVYTLLNHSVPTAKYAVPVETGDFYVCDCILLDADYKQVEGLEYPVPIQKEQLGDLIRVWEYGKLIPYTRDVQKLKLMANVKHTKPPVRSLKDTPQQSNGN